MAVRNPQQEAEYQRALQLRARNGLPLNSPAEVPFTPSTAYGASAGTTLAQGSTSGVPTISDRYSSGAQSPSQSLGQQLFQSYRSQFGAQPFTPIAELPQSYYDSLKAGLQNDLTQQFFGKGGTLEGAMAGETAAGRLDSPVGRRMLQQTVTEPFSRQITQIGLGVAQQQQQAHQQIAQLNQTFNQQYNDLAYRIAQSERGILSAEQEAQLDADIRAYEAQLNSATESAKIAGNIDIAQMQNETEQQKNAIDYLRTPIQYNETTQPIASKLNQRFGGNALPSGGPIPLNNTYNSLYTPNAYMSQSEINKLPPTQLNALPSQGQFLGQIVRGPDGRNYAWRGSTGWQVVYS